MNIFIRNLALTMLGLIIAGLIVGQILIPIVTNAVASEMPEVAHLASPYSVAGIATLACFQIALIFIALIVARESADAFFSATTRKWIRISGTLITLGFTIPVAVGSHLLITMNAGGPSVVLGMTGSTILAVAMACLTYITLHAFDSAREEHHELGGVI